MADQDLPPIYVQFKADIAQLMASLQQIDSGLEKFKNGAEDAGKSAQNLGAQTVAAGVLIAQTLTAAWQKAYAFAKESMNAFATVGGEVNKMRKVLGGSAEDMSQLRFAGEATGVSSQKLIVAIRSLSGHLSKNDKVAQSLNMTYRDQKGQLLPTNEILGKIADKFAKMPDGLEKTAAATRIFGRSGIDMLSMLSKGSVGLQELYENANKLGLTLSGDDLTAVKQYTINQRELHAAIQGVQVEIGKNVMPILTSLAYFTRTEIIPAFKDFADGIFGVRGALTNTEGKFYTWGEKVRGVIAWVVQWRDILLKIAKIIAITFAVGKIISYFNTFAAGLASVMKWGQAMIKIFRAVAAAESLAAVAGAFATGGINLAAGAAALAIGAGVGLLAWSKGLFDTPDFELPKLPDIKAADNPDADPMKEFSQKTVKRKMKTFRDTLMEEIQKTKFAIRLQRLGGSENFVQSLLGGENWRADAQRLIGGGKAAVKEMMGLWRQTEAGRKELVESRYISEMKKLKELDGAIRSIEANASLSFETMQNRSFRQRIADMNFYVKQAAAVVKAAQAEENKTRGTKAHVEAVNTLNSAVIQQAKLQAKANEMVAENAKAVAEQNRQQTLLNNTMSASNSYLAAQVRTSGVTASQAGSFIEVPVIIDGQTVFRVIQKHSLMNDRRNVSNGLSKSGSTIG